MTKKDYELIAGAISEARKKALGFNPKVNTFQNAIDVTMIIIESSLADVLTEDNKLFDRRRFFNACS